MLKPEIQALIEDQVNYEFFSAYIYLGIHVYYADKNLNGFANWFQIQTQEERDHAMLMVQYLLNNGATVKLPEVHAVVSQYKTFDAPLKAAYEHELAVTSRIHNIYDAALAAKDFRTTQFLDWFVKEQGEEEKNIEDIIKRYDLFANDTKGLYNLDAELATRVYAPPTLVL
ncbi:MAG: ferritin [Ethanoligenens sp.]